MKLDKEAQQIAATALLIFATFSGIGLMMYLGTH
jgi:hypothetical protein